MNRGGRGSILERLQLAQETGCELIEVPADFIKNPTEISLTGLTFGGMLDTRAISILYRREQVPASCRLVLHTEPEINLPSQLRWYDRDWLDSFVRMQLALIEHIGVLPTAIEIHPGKIPNAIDHIVGSVRKLIDSVGNRFGQAPLILLENRTGHVVSDGRDLVNVWRVVEQLGADFSRQFGIVLDVQQLFTQTAGRKGTAPFLDSLRLIPNDALRAFHIHHRHGVPSLKDPIPWAAVFQRIRELREILINPEIHHRKGIAAAKEFCSQLWDAHDETTNVD
jgi:hypothetical protein